jgi:hypothetical protein
MRIHLFPIVTKRRLTVQKTGKVTFSNGEPSLDDRTILAICGDPNPFVAAGTFLKDRGIRDGDTIQVNGDSGTIGGVAVFCMTDASRVDTKGVAARKKAVATKKAPAKKAPTKKAAPKPVSKTKGKAGSKSKKGAPSKSRARKPGKR